MARHSEAPHRVSWTVPPGKLVSGWGKDRIWTDQPTVWKKSDPHSLMTDLLVKLYDLPPAPEGGVVPSEIEVRRARAPEREPVLDFAERTFGAGWRGECAVAFGGHPLTCFLAAEGDEIVGFACYDATFRGFFGPVGVAEPARGKGIGTALTLACLHAMRESGYAYAVIGATKMAGYYRKLVGAEEIPNSWPGAYAALVKTKGT